MGPSNQITPSQSRSSGSLRRARSSRRSAPRSSSAQCTIRIRPAARARAPARRRRPPAVISWYWPGKKRCRSSPVASLLAVRASIRPKKTSTSIRATWVESTRSTGSWKVATLSDCEWRSAAEPVLGANGSWTCTQVERHGAQQPLERAADVERKRRRPAPRAARQRDALADAEHPRVLALEQRPGSVARLPDQPPALANRGARVRRRDDQDPMAALRRAPRRSAGRTR